MTFREKLIDAMEPITISGMDQSKVSAIVAALQHQYMQGAAAALRLAAEDAERDAGFGVIRDTPYDHWSVSFGRWLRQRASEVSGE